jgi:hypothetical protein
MSDSTMKEIFTRAANDPKFAKDLVTDPAKYKDEYQLTEDQMETISGAAAAAEPAPSKSGGYE